MAGAMEVVVGGEGEKGAAAFERFLAMARRKEERVRRGRKVSDEVVVRGEEAREEPKPKVNSPPFVKIFRPPSSLFYLFIDSALELTS